MPTLVPERMLSLLHFYITDLTVVLILGLPSAACNRLLTVSIGNSSINIALPALAPAILTANRLKEPSVHFFLFWSECLLAVFVGRKTCSAIQCLSCEGHEASSIH